MSPPLYLAYGSNLHPERLRRRIASAQLAGTWELEGFALRFHKRGGNGFGCCNVVAGAGPVHAALFQVDPAERAILDHHEGLGAGYAEKRIQLPERGEAFFYVADAASIDDSLRPCSWYKALVLAGCRFHGFPQSYQKAIEALDSARDPDTDRHGRNMSLARELEDNGASAPAAD